MMRQEELVPKRRFEGFADEWETRNLEDVIEGTYNGQTPSRFKKHFWDGNINWLSSGELNKGIIIETVEKITEDGRKAANLKVVPKNTFVMAITGLEAAGTRGNCAILGIDTTLNQSCMAIYPQKKLLDVNFLFHWYRKNGESYGLKYTQGTKQQSYNATLINKFKITLPNVKEQQKIGEFFKHLDEMIALQQKKIDKTTALKSAYLAEMFPAEGERVPKRRFAGYKDEWEFIRVGDLYNSIESGNRLPKTMLKEGSVPYVIAKTTDNGVLMRIDESTLDYHGNKMKKFPGRSITFSIDNPKATFLQKESFYTSNIMRVLYNEQYNNNHSVFIMESLKKLSENYNWSIKFSGPVVMESLISMPVAKSGKINWEEIEKVGQVINNLNDMLILRQQKLEKLQATKQAYLNEMFV